MLLNERGHRSCPYLFTLILPVSCKQRAQLKTKNDRKEGHLPAAHAFSISLALGSPQQPVTF